MNSRVTSVLWISRPRCGRSQPEAADRLSVYYVCLGLGFTGMYVGQPEKIREYMDENLPARPAVDGLRPAHQDQRAGVFLHGYADLTDPPGDKILLVVVAFVLSLSVLVISYGLYYKASSDLKDSVGQITHQAQGAKP